MKRANSLPLSPVVLTRPYYRENRYLQVLRTEHCSAKLVSMIKFDKRGNSFNKHFERNPNIRSILWISLLSRNQTNTKRTRNIFLQLSRICFRILSRQSEYLNVFCKVFSQIAFRDKMLPFHRYQWRQPARAQAPLPLPHAFFDTTNLYIPLSRLAALTCTESPDLRTEKKGLG